MEQIFDNGKNITEEDRQTYLCITKMLAYLLSWFTCHINEYVSKNTTINIGKVNIVKSHADIKKLQKLFHIVVYYKKRIEIQLIVFSVKKPDRLLRKTGNNPDRKSWNFCIDGYKYHYTNFLDHQLLKTLLSRKL